MPTDEPASPRRHSRRALGRGPGTAGAGAPVPPPPVAQPAPEPVREPEPEPAREPEVRPEPEPQPEPVAEPEQPVSELQEQSAPAPVPGPAPEPDAQPAVPLPAPAPAQQSAPLTEPAPVPTSPTPAAPVPPAASGPVAEPVPATETEDRPPDADARFTVRLANFEGPFDLLLQLISKHKLDVTEVALSKVTDEFMAYIRAMGPDWDLDQTTEFLVVAATLLDLKAARLLPAAEVEDEADLALLEARDLLFARLLQYRAYKQIADIFSERLAAEALSRPRTVGLEPHHAELLPEVVISIGPEGFAKLAVKAMRPKPKPQVYVDHIHAPLVSVREQAQVVIDRLRAAGEASFRQLTEDAPDTLTVVARFLALLELYRERAVALDQEEALGSLMVRWTGTADGAEPVVTDEFDQEPGDRADEKEKA